LENFLSLNQATAMHGKEQVENRTLQGVLINNIIVHAGGYQ